jgi:hypothetical protein
MSMVIITITSMITAMKVVTTEPQRRIER